jgi:hypothetical protein
MLSPRKFLVLMSVTFVMCVEGGTARAGEDEFDGQMPSEIRDKYLVVLCVEREFDAAKREAKRVSIASGIQFSMNGKVWDSQRGLILPDDCNDPMYCGEYVPRRYNELDLTATNPVGYISVEKSDAYPYLQKGYYIALAVICDSQQGAQKELLKFNRFSPKAYVVKTQIYMGCIH